jgi:hypothetical protein
VQNSVSLALSESIEPKNQPVSEERGTEAPRLAGARAWASWIAGDDRPSWLLKNIWPQLSDSPVVVRP